MIRRFLTVAAVGAALLAGALAAADIYIFLKRPALTTGESAIYTIESGASFAQITRDLEQRGWLTRGMYWLMLAHLQGHARSIKAGEYRLAGPLTPPQLLERLVTGKTRQFSLTLVPGWTFRQVMEAVAKHPSIEQTLTRADDIMALLGEPGMHPEGWFFPDTYHFPRGATDLEFLRRGHALMRERLRATWRSRAVGTPLKTPYEALILASIIEKEAAVADERAVIAGVFLSRLAKGMRLQTDPTVVYGMGETYAGNIRAADLRRDTPYNTYVHKGLPPTPIAMPSGAALEAVSHPASTDALFFVATKDGRHYFSATYEEHRQAVVKYQLGGDASRYKAKAN